MIRGLNLFNVAEWDYKTAYWRNYTYTFTEDGQSCRGNTELLRPTSALEFDAVVFMIKTEPALSNQGRWHNLGGEEQSEDTV